MSIVNAVEHALLHPEEGRRPTIGPDGTVQFEVGPPAEPAHNVFQGMTQGELRAAMAEQLNLILGNHIRAVWDGSRDLTAEDILPNSHLVDRAGALLNATMAYGHYGFDALAWTVKMDQDVEKRLVGTDAPCGEAP